MFPRATLFETHLAVRDLDRSAAFYRDVMLFELAATFTERSVAFFWIGRPGGAMLGLWRDEAPAVGVQSHIAFQVRRDDVLAAPDRLRAQGLTLEDHLGRPIDEPVVLAWMPAVSVYFRDPDGHQLEYISMLDDEPRPDLGVPTWSDYQSTAQSTGPARRPRG